MNIEQLAREAGFTPQRDERLFTDMLTRFAALVRAQALEEAARAANEFLTRGRSPHGQSVAAAIRALQE